MITADRVREVLHYDPETGDFVWKKKLSATSPVGKKAGCKALSYWCIGVDGHVYQAHRLAWLYMTGQWPKEFIDHIDGNGANNKFSNLREATNAQNGCNRGRQSNGTSGFKGVHFFKRHQKWTAKISKGGKTINLGYFSSPEEAHKAYCDAAKDLHGEFANDGIEA